MELWYSAEQLRAVVLALGLHHVAIVQDHSHGCEIAADLDACRRIVEALPGRVRAPLDGSVRSSLVATAIELGGPGAWARLVEYRDAPPIRTLEHVAGVPVEQLLSAWHAWVLDNRPVAYAELPTRSLLTLLWIAFFATLAMRSTRWRLG